MADLMTFMRSLGDCFYHATLVCILFVEQHGLSCVHSYSEHKLIQTQI